MTSSWPVKLLGLVTNLRLTAMATEQLSKNYFKYEFHDRKIAFLYINVLVWSLTEWKREGVVVPYIDKLVMN